MVYIISPDPYYSAQLANIMDVCAWGFSHVDHSDAINYVAGRKHLKRLKPGSKVLIYSGRDGDWFDEHSLNIIKSLQRDFAHILMINI